MAKKKEKRKITEEDIEKMPEELEPEEDFGKVFAAWEFPEFEKPDRKKWWYFAFAAAIILLLIYSYFSRNPLFAIIVVIFAIIYIVNERKGPSMIQITFTEDGIILGNKLIEYTDLKNFYIIYFPPQVKNLYLQPKSNIKQRMTIPLEQQNPVEIRQILLQYLEEDLEKEDIPSSEGISRMLKL